MMIVLAGLLLTISFLAVQILGSAVLGLSLAQTGKRSMAERSNFEIKHLIGFWALLSLSVSLFAGSWMAVQLRPDVSGQVGVVLGLLIWASMTVLLLVPVIWYERQSLLKRVQPKSSIHKQAKQVTGTEIEADFVLPSLLQSFSEATEMRRQQGLAKTDEQIFVQAPPVDESRLLRQWVSEYLHHSQAKNIKQATIERDLEQLMRQPVIARRILSNKLEALNEHHALKPDLTPGHRQAELVGVINAQTFLPETPDLLETTLQLEPATLHTHTLSFASAADPLEIESEPYPVDVISSMLKEADTGQGMLEAIAEPSQQRSLPPLPTLLDDKTEQLSQQALQHAKQTRQLVLAAGWWLFASMVGSAFAAGVGGWLATLV